MYFYHSAPPSHRLPLAYAMVPRTVPTLVNRFTNPRPPAQNGTTPSEPRILYRKERHRTGNDHPYDVPGYRAAPCAPRPAEPLWELRRDRDTWACELQYHDERGVEVHILHNDNFRISQRFSTRALAAQWAEAERRVLDAGRDDDPVPWES